VEKLAYSSYRWMAEDLLERFWWSERILIKDCVICSSSSYSSWMYRGLVK
jgi:hypothetical protein